jgi:hypothetical protein
MTSHLTEPAIAAAGMRKSYGDKIVLDGVDLHVPEGTIFALLGPNGAGKTTIVHILSTLIGADGGDIRVAGHDLVREAEAVGAAIGVTGQYSAIASPAGVAKTPHGFQSCRRPVRPLCGHPIRVMSATWAGHRHHGSHWYRQSAHSGRQVGPLGSIVELITGLASQAAGSW